MNRPGFSGHFRTILERRRSHKARRLFAHPSHWQLITSDNSKCALGFRRFFVGPSDFRFQVMGKGLGRRFAAFLLLTDTLAIERVRSLILS